MIFEAEDLLDDLAQRAEASPPGRLVDRSVLLSALQEAERLCAGDPASEPAAMFFALARRSRAFGKLAADFVPDIAHACAIGCGFSLDASIELDIFRARILRGEMKFEDVREELSRRLRRRAP